MRLPLPKLGPHVEVWVLAPQREVQVRSAEASDNSPPTSPIIPTPVASGIPDATDVPAEDSEEPDVIVVSEPQRKAPLVPSGMAGMEDATGQGSGGRDRGGYRAINIHDPNCRPMRAS